MKTKLTNPWMAVTVAGLALLGAFAPTAVRAAAAADAKYIFFPPAPDAPRVQFLTSFSSLKELRGRSGNGFMNYLTGQQAVDTPISKPYGAFADKNNLYICDTAVGLVLRVDYPAKRIWAIAPEGPAAFKLPLNVAVDANGWIYEVDSVRNQVTIIDTNENLVAIIGGKGLMEPRDVALTADRIYVSDVVNHCVHVLDKGSRQPLFDIPHPADKTNRATALFQPDNITLDSAGRLYVSDIGGFRVQVYNTNGDFLRSVGKYGDNYGEFARPKGVAVDRENRLYAVDAAGQLVQMFDENGHLLMWFGEPSGSKVGLVLPTKVVIDYDNVDFFKRFIAPDFQVEHLIIVISQYGPRKVSVFGFGHKK
jgi:sugar lactone lactonase YvrE